MRPRLSKLRWIALLLLVTALFYWKLGFSNKFTFLNSPDLVGQVLPWYEVEARAWHEGVFPLWDPYVWSGQSLLGQMQPGGAFPLNWPLFVAPLDYQDHIRFRFIHLQRLFAYLFAALFAYGLARQLKRSPMASFLTGAAFACVGALSGFDWPQMLNGAIWLPLTLLLFHRSYGAVTRNETLAWAVLCGGSIGMSLLSGHHQLPFYSLMAFGFLFIFSVWEDRDEGRGRATNLGLVLGVAGVTAFAVAALQLLPAFEYAELAYRWVSAAEPITGHQKIPYYVHEKIDFPPVYLFGLVTPRLYDGANVFVGWTVAVLAFYGVVSGWRERWVRGYTLLALLAVAYTLGGFSLVHGLIYQFLPTAQAVRSADRAILVAQLALFVLAAFGLDELINAVKARLSTCLWLRWSQWVLAFNAAVIYLGILLIAMKGDLSSGKPDLFAVSALAALALLACLEAFKRGGLNSRAFGVALIALMLCESYTTQFYELSEVSDPERRSFIDEYEETYEGSMLFLSERAKEEDRFRFDLSEELDGINIGSRFGLEQSDGYLVTVSKDLFEVFNQLGWEEAADLLNTRYTVARTQQRADQVEVFADANGVKVFMNPMAKPRTWMTTSTEFITQGNGDAAEDLAGSDCVIEENAVKIAAWTTQSVTLEAKPNCPGYVILADPYFPGWEARINGEPTPILRYHNGLRAVRVDAGQEEIEFHYRPSTVFWGAWLTGFGFILCGGTGWWLRFRSNTLVPR